MNAYDVIVVGTGGMGAAAAARSGADLRSGVTVRDWRIDGGGVVVEADGGPYTANRLVLCPGPWAAGLLRLPAAPLAVLRKSLFWYAPEPADRAIHAAAALPCFAFDTPAGFFYGYPALDDRGLKVANHSGGLVVAGVVSRRLPAAARGRAPANELLQPPLVR
jgi:glycine/D-amino acid oxidase-like deaminating enzyme